MDNSENAIVGRCVMLRSGARYAMLTGIWHDIFSLPFASSALMSSMRKTEASGTANRIKK
jgi:hypothetical protein